ncbi:MAG: hypothetical protein HYR64_01650 [Fimbriimonas ginsengisoli]|uniref:Uncharacterized protein n=1 Tax=Fimbriimonas ginsengisoli TaxID=1005039 RepID=A0A931LU02_FIMGI|nr:hypothetical protein [Fimbriimonas ginsengisoli]
MKAWLLPILFAGLAAVFIWLGVPALDARYDGATRRWALGQWGMAIICLAYVGWKTPRLVARILAAAIFCLATVILFSGSDWYRIPVAIYLDLVALGFWTLLPRPIWRK